MSANRGAIPDFHAAKHGCAHPDRDVIAEDGVDGAALAKTFAECHPMEDESPLSDDRTFAYDNSAGMLNSEPGPDLAAGHEVSSADEVVEEPYYAT